MKFIELEMIYEASEYGKLETYTIIIPAEEILFIKDHNYNSVVTVVETEVKVVTKSAFPGVPDKKEYKVEKSFTYARAKGAVLNVKTSRDWHHSKLTPSELHAEIKKQLESQNEQF